MQRGGKLLVGVARGLLAADAAMWTVFAVVIGTKTVSIGDVAPATLNVIAFLMLGNAVALALSAWLALRGSKTADYAAILLMAINTVLSFADQVGVADLVVFGLSLAVLVVLVLGVRARRKEQSAIAPTR